jgi:hypothetical protein
MLAINHSCEGRLKYRAATDMVKWLIYYQKQRVGVSMMRLVGSSTVGALGILLVFPISQGWASCLNPPVNVESINQFKSDPQALIAPNSDTRTIEAMTRDLAGTDASLAADLVNLAERAIPRFQTAIAAGLAQAAMACQSIDQKSALAIQQAVAGFADGQFQASFAAVAGDISTAATEAASASATGSAGSVPVTNSNNSSAASVPTSGSVGAVTALTLTSSGLSINVRNSIATTAADPVSPTQ